MAPGFSGVVVAWRICMSRTVEHRHQDGKRYSVRRLTPRLVPGSRTVTLRVRSGLRPAAALAGAALEVLAGEVGHCPMPEPTASRRYRRAQLWRCAMSALRVGYNSGAQATFADKAAGERLLTTSDLD